MGMTSIIRNLLMMLLSLSFSGAVLAAALLVLQATAGQRLGQRWRYYIWLLVVARLLLPITVQNSVTGHLFDRAVDYGAAPQTATMQAEEPAREWQPQAAPPAGELPERAQPWRAREATGEENNMPVAAKTPVEGWAIAGVLWLGAAAVLWLRTMAGYRRYRRLLERGNQPVTDPMVQAVYGEVCRELAIRRPPALRFNPQVTTPMLAGLLRPVIVLPPLDVDREEARYVFLHELTHHKRGDSWYKLLIQLTVCIHWFNPLVYRVRREMEAACELSCDEAVLRRLDHQSRLDYGEVLLTVLKSGRERQRVPALLLGEDAKTIKSRLTGILNFRRRTKRMLVAAGLMTLLALVLALALGVYTSPRSRSYNNDAIIARDVESMRTLGILSGISDSGSVDMNVERLDGVHTFLTMEVTEATTVELQYNVSIREGKHKIVLTGNAQVLDTVVEGSGSGRKQWELSPGTYKLKSVGQRATAQVTIAMERNEAVVIDGMERAGRETQPADGEQGSVRSPQSLAEARYQYVGTNGHSFSKSLRVCSYDGSWRGTTTVEGLTLQERLDEKLLYIENAYRERQAPFLIQEGIGQDEITDVSGIQYLFDQSQIYRDLVTSTDFVQVAGGSSFSLLGDAGEDTQYERHVFYLPRATTMDLRATYSLSQGKLGLLLVSPQGEVVYRQDPVASFSDRTYLSLAEGLWSIVVVNEMENGQQQGEKYIMGHLADENGVYNTGTPSKEEVLAEYAAFGFSYDDMTYTGNPVSYFQDQRADTWLSMRRKAAGDNGLYLIIVRDHSVPGPFGFGQIERIDHYTKTQWEALFATENE